MSFAPQLEILPASQRALWNELGALPTDFVLYGGTGLALRLGHRVSVDFDFFSSQPLNQRALAGLPFFAQATTLVEEKNSWTGIVSRGGPVKVSFFGGIDFGRVGTPDRADGVAVASLLDLAGTKLKALLQRVEAKDYLDVAALLREGVALEAMLGASRALFGPAFNPLMAQKTLAYFEGEALAALDVPTKALLQAAAIRDVKIPELPKLAVTLD